MMDRNVKEVENGEVVKDPIELKRKVPSNKYSDPEWQENYKEIFPSRS